MAKRKKNYSPVTMNPIVPIVGFLALVVCTVLFVLSFTLKWHIAASAVIGAFMLLFLRMALTVNERITYDGGGFVYRDFLGISHAYRYAEVKKISFGKDIWITVGRRRILVDSLMNNGRKFGRMVLLYAKDAKVIMPTDRKLFRGNIDSPGEMVFVYALVGAVFVIFLIVVLLMDFSVPKPEELTHFSAKVTEFEIVKANTGPKETRSKSDRAFITFENEDGKFWFFWFDEEALQKDFMLAAQEQRGFSVYYDGEASKSGYMVYELACGDERFLTLEQTAKQRLEMKRQVVMLISGFLAFWALLTAVSFFFMTYADKYPRAARLFVKPEYIINRNILSNKKYNGKL